MAGIEMPRFGWCGRLCAVGLSIVAVASSGTAVAAPSLQLGTLRPVDVAPQKVSTTFTRTSVASDGHAWLAVGEFGEGLTATRIQADGSLAGDGFPIGPSNSVNRDPHVAFDGVDFVVAFQTNGSTRIAVQNVTSSGPGEVVDLDLIGFWGGIDLAIDEGGTPRVLACTTNYVTSTCATAEVIDLQGKVYPSFDLPFPAVRVDWDFSGETGLAIVETEGHAVVLVDISTEGQLLGSHTLDAGAGVLALPSIIATPDGYAATWRRKDGVRVVALSPTGVVTAEQLLPGDESSGYPVLTTTADAWLLLSGKESAACQDCVDLYAQSLDPELAESPAAGVLIAEGINDGMTVAAANASDALVVVTSYDPGSTDAALVSVDQPTPEPERQGLAFVTPPQGGPFTATSKDGWIVAWREHDKVRNVVVDLDGQAHLSPLDLPPDAWRLEAGDEGWLLVSGTGKCTRLDSQGTLAAESYTLPKDPVRLVVARSGAGWAVAWSRWVSYWESALSVDFFTFDGAHQSSTELAQRINTGDGANYPIQFDIAAAADGFRVVWSTPATGTQALELDAAAQPRSAPHTIDPRGADSVNVAFTPQASWFDFSIGSSEYFLPMGLEPQREDGPYDFLMAIRAIGNTAVLARASGPSGYQGALTIAAAGEYPQDSLARFPTYAGEHGFTFSKPIGSQALIVTQVWESLYGTPQSRLNAGVVTVDDGLGNEGGAGGAGGAGNGAGGSNEEGLAGAGGGGQSAGGVGGSPHNEAGASGGGSGPGNFGGEPAIAGGAGGDGSNLDSGGAASSNGGGASPPSAGGVTSSEGGGDVDSSNGGDPKPAGPRLSSGCGCRLGSEREPIGSGYGLGLLLFAIVRRQRRVPASTSSSARTPSRARGR